MFGMIKGLVVSKEELQQKNRLEAVLLLHLFFTCAPVVLYVAFVLS